MLILTRKLGESTIIGENIQISVVEINKHNIKLGINAPKNITIYREEVFKKIKEENKLSSTSDIIDLTNIPKTINNKSLFL
ncbi:MAG: carbon storage regulator [Candidatus Scalindua rubra]|uniref:Translational regulator CsrA n=1 Tax=Candidatus Scalindua rubra TaxID=1872076 RepID=A0A1E3X966_9BACT|nr:MAG: carbon storage regulator [Candidatus Scalindua rubra]